tara:strand:- start:14457 stop:14753 length:297 start_codon:yes stop_codon:yes gene_type:complete
MPCPRFQEPDDAVEPEELGFIVTYDGDVVSEQLFTRMDVAVDFSKDFTLKMARDTGYDFEKVTIELVYDLDENGDVVWENDVLKTVEFDATIKTWEIK